jgi:hypothetical protein
MAADIKPEYVGKIICSMQEYHAAEAVGSSALRQITNQTPAHYLYDKNNPSQPTPSQRLGTLIHEAILEPYRFAEMSVIMPDFSGTGSRAAKEDWLLNNHGKIILNQETKDQIDGIIKSLIAHPSARQLMSDGHAEESLFWRDAETGMQCKARPDFVREGRIVVDVKSTLDASYRSFQKDIANYGYDQQAAHYLDGCSEVLGGNYDTFLIVAVEKTPPYAVAVYQFDETMVNEGRAKNQAALKTLAECKKTGIYPAYPTGITPIALPSWAVSRE